jgi:hypothetical protein
MAAFPSLEARNGDPRVYSIRPISVIFLTTPAATAGAGTYAQFLPIHFGIAIRLG